MSIDGKTVTPGEADKGNSGLFCDCYSFIGRCSAGNHHGYPGIRIFFHHTCRLPSGAAYDTPGQVDMVKDCMAYYLINRIMPAHIAAFYNTFSLVEKNRTMDCPGFSPYIRLNFTGTGKYILRGDVDVR